MPQTRPPTHLLQELVLVGDLVRDVVADAIKAHDLDPDATAEMP
jgi:hypothetical protein